MATSAGPGAFSERGEGLRFFRKFRFGVAWLGSQTPGKGGPQPDLFGIEIFFSSEIFVFLRFCTPLVLGLGCGCGRGALLLIARGFVINSARLCY